VLAEAAPGPQAAIEKEEKKRISLIKFQQQPTKSQHFYEKEQRIEETPTTAGVL